MSRVDTLRRSAPALLAALLGLAAVMPSHGGGAAAASSAPAAAQWPAAAAEAATSPAPLSRPALVTPKALGAAMLAVGRAGDRLVAVGERGTVLLSDNAGAQWRQARVPVSVSLTAVRFIDARTGWATGHLGVILKTEDGGESWALQLDGVRAAAAKLAAAGDDEVARRQAQRLVEDGPDKPFLDIDFADPLNGVAVGAYNLAFTTRDGGATWQPLRLPNPKSLHLYGVRLAQGQVVIAGEQGLLLRSTDGAQSFTTLTPPYAGSFFGVALLKSGTLLAYGLRGTVVRTADQGATWDKPATGVQVSISAATTLDDGALALLTQTGALLVSRDDGRSFRQAAAAPQAAPAAGLASTASGALVLAGLRGLHPLNAPATP